MNRPITLSQKLRVMARLRGMGITDEKAIAAVSVEELLLNHENIPATDLRIITGLKKAVKEGRIYSYLQKGEPEKNNAEKEENDNGPCQI